MRKLMMDKVCEREEHLKAGRLSQAGGKYDLALEEFELLVKFNPKDEATQFHNSHL